MIITAKDLRFKISLLFDLLSKGEEIIVIHRGKVKAKLIAFEEFSQIEKTSEVFGMWKDKSKSVDETLRDLRECISIDLFRPAQKS